MGLGHHGLDGLVELEGQLGEKHKSLVDTSDMDLVLVVNVSNDRGSLF